MDKNSRWRQREVMLMTPNWLTRTKIFISLAKRLSTWTNLYEHSRLLLLLWLLNSYRLRWQMNKYHLKCSYLQKIPITKLYFTKLNYLILKATLNFEQAEQSKHKYIYVRRNLKYNGAAENEAVSISVSTRALELAPAWRTLSEISTPLPSNVLYTYIYMVHSVFSFILSFFPSYSPRW